MIPCVLAPDVCVLSEKSVVECELSRGLGGVSGADLDPKGGLSAETSWTDDAVFGVRVGRGVAMLSV